MSSFDLESVELPSIVSATHCVLLPKDPDHIYAYWDYSQEDLNRLLYKFHGSAQLLLRVYDVTGINFNGSNARYSWDVSIDSSIKKKHIQVWQDNAQYCVELGVANKNRFVALTRSNKVRCAPKSFSKRDDLIWQDIKQNRESKPYIKQDIKEYYEKLTQQSHPPSKSELKPIVSQLLSTDPKPSIDQQPLTDQQSSIDEQPLPQQKLTVHRGPSTHQQLLSPQHLAKTGVIVKYTKNPKIYYLTAEDIRAYYKKFFTLVARRGKYKIASVKDVVKGLLKGVRWEKVSAITTSHQGTMPKAHPGASEGVLTTDHWGASENLLDQQPGASEGRLNKREFFFEIWTELLVHGRTEADALVWLNSQGVILNPDGTFNLRYALPDGEIPLKFTAQSADGVEERHLYTRVEREKTIGFPKMLKESHGK